MAGEWVTAISTIGGGVVGVAGTLGATWLTQRREEREATRQRRYALEDAGRSERKEVYLRYLAQIDAIETTLAEFFGTAVPDRDAVPISEAVARLGSILNEVQIVGSDSVKPKAFSMFSRAFMAGGAAQEGDMDGALLQGEALEELLEAIADDLRLAPPG